MAKLLKPLPKGDFAKVSKACPSWKIAPDMSKATLSVVFKRHVDAIAFLARLAIYSEVHKHHGEVVLTEAKVKVTVSTEKHLTSDDVRLMKHINVLLKNGG